MVNVILCFVGFGLVIEGELVYSEEEICCLFVLYEDVEIGDEKCELFDNIFELLECIVC